MKARWKVLIMVLLLAVSAAAALFGYSISKKYLTGFPLGMHAIVANAAISLLNLAVLLMIALIIIHTKGNIRWVNQLGIDAVILLTCGLLAEGIIGLGVAWALDSWALALLCLIPLAVAWAIIECIRWLKR